MLISDLHEVFRNLEWSEKLLATSKTPRYSYYDLKKKYLSAVDDRPGTIWCHPMTDTLVDH